MKTSDSESDNEIEAWSHLSTNRTLDGGSFKTLIS